MHDKGERWWSWLRSQEQELDAIRVLATAERSVDSTRNIDELVECVASLLSLAQTIGDGVGNTVLAGEALRQLGLIDTAVAEGSDAVAVWDAEHGDDWLPVVQFALEIARQRLRLAPSAEDALAKAIALLRRARIVECEKTARLRDVGGERRRTANLPPPDHLVARRVSTQTEGPPTDGACGLLIRAAA
ncbi:MAG: hypothetical protein QOK28_2005 [Actinomycetota bacterium]|jgi:hypothetical protein